MGLDVSHGAYCGSYGTFHRFRLAVATAAGVKFPEEGLPANLDQGLSLFLSHSDCDGEFTPEECRIVADALTPLFISIDPEFITYLANFISGARRAHTAGEPLEFS